MKVITMPPYPVGKAVGNGTIFLQEKVDKSIRVWKLTYPNLIFTSVMQKRYSMDDGKILRKFPYYGDDYEIIKVKKDLPLYYFSGEEDFKIPHSYLEYSCKSFKLGKHKIINGPAFTACGQTFGRQKIIFADKNIIITERLILLRHTMPKIYVYKRTTSILGITGDGRIVTGI